MMSGRRAWLGYAAVVVSNFLPMLVSVPYGLEEMMLVIRDVFVVASVSWLWVSPVIHIATVVLLLVVVWRGEIFGRVFSGFWGVLFVFFAVANHVAVTGSYGLVVITSNLVMILVVGVYWFWEVARPRNVWVFRRLAWWRYWVIPFAVLAFWTPMNVDLTPNFSPVLLLTSEYGVMLCYTTPVALALLTLIYPRVNVELLRITSLAGLIIGLFNIMAYFMMTGYTLWNLVLHTPLIFISLYGLLIGRITGE
jgi:hypothetical protein